MGALNSKVDDMYYSKERYVTPQSKYDLKDHTRSMFPLRVNIYSSCSGLNQDYAYQDVDVYFAKHTKMLMTVSSDGVPRMIPLNCDIKCCIIDDFSDDYEKCLEGRRFEGIEELMKANPLPKVVYAVQGFYEDDYSFSVDMGDVLIIDKVEVNEGEVSLKCYESCSTQPRWLKKTVTTSFTTKASEVALDLSVISSFDCLKLPARMLISSDNDELDGSVYTLTNFVSKKSVIASLRYDSLADLSSMRLFEVYLDSPIEFEIIKLTELEMQKLRVKADDVLTKVYSSSKLDRIVATPADKIQSLLLHNVKEGHEFGIEVLHPEPSYSDKFPGYLMKANIDKQKRKMNRVHFQQSKALLNDLETQMQCYSDKIVRRKRKTSSSVNYGKLLSGVWSNRALGGSSDDVNLLQLSGKKASSNGDYVDMDIGIQKGTPTLERKDLDTTMDSPSGIRRGIAVETHTRTPPPSRPISTIIGQDYRITGDYANTRTQTQSSPLMPVKQHGVNGQDQAMKENKKIISQLTIEQVLELLNKLGLAEYKAMFEAEMITGSLFLDLDDTILAELGMTKKLHRLKIHRLLDGRELAKNLIDKMQTLL